MPDPPIQASIERGWKEVEAIEAAFARDEIDQAEWHRRMAMLVVPAYLAADNPRAQSGYGGDAGAWRQARGMVAEAIDRPGMFLDVGCANGLLMESVVSWCTERGIEIEPYGLEIAPPLAELARRRLPHWAARIYEGNAIEWSPPWRFDFVRTGLEYVPLTRRGDLIERLLRRVVAPNGRLLIGPYSEERDETRAAPSQEERVLAWGFTVAGRFERPHPRDRRVVRRLVYIDAVSNGAR